MYLIGSPWSLLLLLSFFEQNSKLYPNVYTKAIFLSEKSLLRGEQLHDTTSS